MNGGGSDEGGHGPYPEKRSASNYLQPIAKGVPGAIPLAGGILSEVIGEVWQPALERRRDEWFRELGKRMDRLEATHSDLKKLLETEQMLTVTALATLSAMSTHQEEKREALRAAVVNSAIAAEPDHEMQLLFLRLIDQLTAAQVQLLRFIDDPGAGLDARGVERPSITMGSTGLLIERAFPEWNQEFYSLMHADLERAGLSSGISGMMTAQGIWAGRTTDLGKRFLRFISEPEGSEDQQEET
jgi:hypothetical protein